MKGKLTRTIAVLTILASLLAGFLLPVIDVLAPLEMSYTETLTGYSGVLYGTKTIGQGFIPSKTFTLASISVAISKAGSPSGNVSVGIYSDSVTHFPDGSVNMATGALAYGTYDLSSVNASGEWITVSMITPVNLIVSTQYYICVNRYPSEQEDNIGVGFDETGDYSGEYNRRVFFNGTSWSEQVNYDVVFKLWSASGSGTSKPTVVTTNATVVGYYPPYLSWGANLNGSITDDGGELCSVGFLWKKHTDELFTSGASVLGNFATGNFSIFSTFDADTQYDFFAYAENSLGLDEGEILTFTTSANETPQIETLSYPINIDLDAMTVRIYGDVLYDAGSNVAGWFQWKPSANTTWNITSTTENLTTGDLFNYLMTDLLMDTSYDYQAVGENDIGTAYGDIISFNFRTITTPVVTTLLPTDITNTWATFWAYCVDDGNAENTFIGFEYRIQGADVWQTLGDWWFHTGENLSAIILSLTPNTAYEYRAKATNYSANLTALIGYGNIIYFRTLATEQTPIVLSDNSTYINDETVRLRGVLQYDGGSPCTLYFQYREIGTSTWLKTLETQNGLSLDAFESLVFGLDKTINYEWRAVAVNNIDTGYGITKTFNLEILVTEGGDNTGSGSSSGIAGYINNLKISLGLTGVMGTWAFMGLLILLISLIFGMAIVSTPDRWIKNAIAVAWLLSSVSVVGAFIFTGQLGIFPILILAGGVVVLIMLVISLKFSGGGIE